MKYISLEKLYRKDKELYKIERARRENAYEAIRYPWIFSAIIQTVFYFPKNPNFLKLNKKIASTILLISDIISVKGVL